MTTRERDLQRAVIQMAETFGWLVYHVADVRRQLRAATSRGFPDLCLARGSRLIFAELKSASGQLRPEQREWLETLRGTAAEVHVWRPRDWRDGTIERKLR